MAKLNMEVADMQESRCLEQQKSADFVDEFRTPEPMKIDVERASWSTWRQNKRRYQSTNSILGREINTRVGIG
jgi:hypothetical protein